MVNFIKPKETVKLHQTNAKNKTLHYTRIIWSKSPCPFLAKRPILEVPFSSPSPWENYRFWIINTYSNRIDESAPQAFLNGVLHWSGHALVNGGFCKMIVSFNVRNDTFGAMMMLTTIHERCKTSVKMSGDSLSIVSLDYSTCCAWVME